MKHIFLFLVLISGYYSFCSAQSEGITLVDYYVDSRAEGVEFHCLSLEFDFFFILRHLSHRSFSFRSNKGVGFREGKFFS